MQSENLFDRSRRRRPMVATWRQANDDTPPLSPNITQLDHNPLTGLQFYRHKLRSPAKFTLALVITTMIIIVQLFIVNHYLDRSLFTRRHAVFKDHLLHSYKWLCHSYTHLNRIQELASQNQVELVIIDPEMIDVLAANQNTGQSDDQWDVEYGGGKHRLHQVVGQEKSIIHLAAINETSGGQPNLKSFVKALKNSSYVMLQYHDVSGTMPHEMYRRKSHQFDDVQADALRDLNHLEDRPPSGMIIDTELEISKLYTEFLTHIFMLNHSFPGAHAPNLASGCEVSQGSWTIPFVVIHISILYNYEYEPTKDWIQSSLHFDEIERHKLLTYGVHSVDFKIPLDSYYIHKKRQTTTLAAVSARLTNIQDPFKMLKVFEQPHERLLNYTDNAYIHCEGSPFNMSGLMGGSGILSDHLKLLDSARPLQFGAHRSKLIQQLDVVLQFMKLLSQTYGHFSYWLTGSSLLAYHKYCELIVMPAEEQLDGHSSGDDLTSNVELGIFSAELDTNMLRDLSNAKIIGLTMITDWRRPNCYVAFHLDESPNLIVYLYLYGLMQGYPRNYFILKNNLTFNHKFRCKLPLKDGDIKLIDGKTSTPDRYVFDFRNLRLCWTRLDRLHPIRVPCDVHDHLIRIYIT